MTDRSIEPSTSPGECLEKTNASPRMLSKIKRLNYKDCLESDDLKGERLPLSGSFG